MPCKITADGEENYDGRSLKTYDPIHHYEGAFMTVKYLKAVAALLLTVHPSTITGKFSLKHNHGRKYKKNCNYV